MKNKLISFSISQRKIPTLYRLCCITLSFFAPLFLAIPSYSQTVNQEKNGQQLNQVKQAISQQKSAIKQVNTQREKLNSQLRTDDVAIAKVVKSIAATQVQLNASEIKLKQLNQQQLSLNKEKKHQETILAKQLRAAYSTGHHDYLKLILNQQDPKEVQRTITYYQYLNDARMKEIGQYENTIKALTEVVSQQQLQNQQYQTYQTTQQQQKLQLLANKKQRQKTVVALNKQLRTSKQRLEQLENEEANLIAAIERLIALSKQEVDLNGLSRLKRKLSWPITAKVNRSFGSRKQGYLKWKGVLMNAPVGRQVKTIHHGKVLFSDWLKGYGLVTIIDHGQGYMSLYGHNQALLKSVGDRVETGEPIALVGQSGGQSKPALYFEIRHNGQAVNPKLWCR